MDNIFIIVQSDKQKRIFDLLEIVHFVITVAEKKTLKTSTQQLSLSMYKQLGSL